MGMALAVLVMCMCSSSAAAMFSGGMNNNEPEAEAVTPRSATPRSATPAAPAAPQPLVWRKDPGVDYAGHDLFHYHARSTPIATEKVCLDKCIEMPNCKFVHFDNAKTLCWGKSDAGPKRTDGGRTNYWKPGM